MKPSQKPRKCKRCEREEKIERHHIIPKSEGGGNYHKNLRNLCSDCHDFIHAERSLINKLAYYKKMIILVEHRLEVLENLNLVDLIKQFGYRSYWIDKTTHGDKRGFKRRGNRKITKKE